MNRSNIRDLQNTPGYPAVSILLPTHRTSPDNKQDPIRVKNLVNQARERLLQEFSARDITPVLAGLDKLVSNIDFRYALDGLALYVNPNVARSFILPFTPRERVIIDENFATRDLVLALNRSPRYWVLALSEKPTRLFEGFRDTLMEITAGGFPMVHTGPGGEQPLPPKPEINRSAYRDERHRQFFRQVDAALGEFIKADPLPLVLVGVDRYLSFFHEVTSHADPIMGTVVGSHDSTSEHDLGQLVWPTVQAHLAAQRERALQELDAAVSAQKYVSAIGEAWRLAHEGRGDLLVVEENYHYPARLDASGLGLLAVDDATSPGVMDDAVDNLIETVLDKGGRVVFVNDGALADHQHVALVLRY